MGPWLMPLIAGGVQAYAQVERGKAQEAQAEREAAIDRYNAELAERKAEQERVAAGEAAKRHEAESKVLLARQRLLYAKAGVGPSRGTPLSVVAKTAQELEADRLQILREGMISEAQKRAEARIFRMRGAGARARGKAAVRGSRLAAAGTILSSVGTRR